MKVETKVLTPPKPAFVPVQVTLTLESQAEVDALYDIGNYNYQIGKLLTEGGAIASIGGAHATTNREVVADLIRPLYEQLRQRISGKLRYPRG